MSNENACRWFPDKCKLGTDTFDTCALNWSDCLLNPEWDFCASFPQLCSEAPKYYFKSM
jgi:hypothetical protein